MNFETSVTLPFLFLWACFFDFGESLQVECNDSGGVWNFEVINGEYVGSIVGLFPLNIPPILCTYLDLSSQGIEFFQPIAFIDFLNLEELILADNQLKEINFGGFFPSLTNLVVVDNQITAIESLSGLSNLEILDLSINSISTLPNDIFNSLNKLTEIHILHNPLECCDIPLPQGRPLTLSCHDEYLPNIMNNVPGCECQEPEDCDEFNNECSMDSNFYKCIKCRSGFYVNSSDLCENCPAQSACILSANQCTNQDTKVCNECKKGFQANSGICSECLIPDDCTKAVGQECIDGTLLLKCETCRQPLFLENGRCVFELSESRQEDDDDSENDGLSTRTIIIIAVAASAAILIIIGILVCCCLCRRRRQDAEKKGKKEPDLLDGMSAQEFVMDGASDIVLQTDAEYQEVQSKQFQAANKTKQAEALPQPNNEYSQTTTVDPYVVPDFKDQIYQLPTTSGEYLDQNNLTLPQAKNFQGSGEYLDQLDLPLQNRTPSPQTSRKQPPPVNIIIDSATAISNSTEYWSNNEEQEDENASRTKNEYFTTTGMNNNSAFAVNNRTASPISQKHLIPKKGPSTGHASTRNDSPSALDEYWENGEAQETMSVYSQDIYSESL